MQKGDIWRRFSKVSFLIPVDSMVVLRFVCLAYFLKHYHSRENELELAGYPEIPCNPRDPYLQLEGGEIIVSLSREQP
jgi:hypothetical protein